MNNQIQSLRNSLEQQKGKRVQLESNLAAHRLELRNKGISLRRYEEAREIIRKIGLKTQQQLQYHISNITSLALEAVFNNPYNLTVEFVQRRNKTECDLKFVRGDMVIDDPEEGAGVGSIDIASFALRIASWSMARPHSRNVMILDEPFKHLKGENANHRALDMINEISKKLKIQIIMISDERIPREDIIESADRVFEVSIRKGKTKIEVL